MVISDIQKAFDYVNRYILLFKLGALDFKIDAMNWMMSYLPSREQIVTVNGTKSESFNETCSIPHGSIICSLLFLFYADDMKAAINCKIHFSFISFC